MKKTDKNIIILTIICIIAIVMWTLMQYSSSQKKAEENDLLAQEEREQPIEKQRDATSEEPEKIIPEISVSELSQKMNAEEITIIDARPITSYENGHILGSIPMENINPENTKRTVVFVTSTGDEDLIMSYYRELAKVKTVYNLTGGISQWQNGGRSLISLNIEPTFSTSGKVRYVEPRDLDAIMKDPAQKEEVVIIDTRRFGNHEKGHISSALNIPFTEIESRYKEIPRTKKIYVYGADETASFRSGVLFYDLGHIDTKTIKGGFAAWQEYGYPIAQ